MLTARSIEKLCRDMGAERGIIHALVTLAEQHAAQHEQLMVLARLFEKLTDALQMQQQVQSKLIEEAQKLRRGVRDADDDDMPHGLMRQ